MKNDIPWSDEDTYVAHLTGDDFDQYVQSHNSVLVMFYAPCKMKLILSLEALDSRLLKQHMLVLGCGHCKKTKPEFETAAETVNTHKVRTSDG